MNAAHKIQKSEHRQHSKNSSHTMNERMNIFCFPSLPLSEKKSFFFVLCTFFIKCKNLKITSVSITQCIHYFFSACFFIKVYIFYNPHRFSLKGNHYLVLWMLFIKSRNPNIGNIFKTIFIQLMNFTQWTISWESTLSAFHHRFCLMKNIFVYEHCS